MTLLRVMVVTVLCVLAVNAKASAPASPRGFDRAWHDVVARYESALRQEGIVGSSLVFMHEGQVLKSVNYGLADQAAHRAIDDNTLYHWASLTKMFTAIAVMQLRERGRLSLDDRIIDYLPEAKQIHNPFGPMSDITLRMLLNHSSGLRSPTFPWSGGQPWQPHEPAKWSQVAAMMPYTEIEFPPGSKYGYSNLGLSMLGRVVEEITGDPIQSYIDKNILKPLGMNDSYFDATPYFMAGKRSHNYYVTGGNTQDNGPEVLTGATVGNGGLNGPPSDMAKFANFLLGTPDGLRARYDAVLARKTLVGMWQPTHPTQETTIAEKMGQAFFIVEHAGAQGRTIRYVGHTGAQSGFRCFVYIQPDTKTAAILAMNTGNQDVAREVGALIKIREDVLTHLFPLFEPEH